MGGNGHTQITTLATLKNQQETDSKEILNLREKVGELEKEFARVQTRQTIYVGILGSAGSLAAAFLFWLIQTKVLT
jgi:hypothetical protein